MKGSVKSLTAGSKLLAIVSSPGLWIVDGRIGMSLYAKNIIVRKKSVLDAYKLSRPLEEEE